MCRAQNMMDVSANTQGSSPKPGVARMTGMVFASLPLLYAVQEHYSKAGNW